MSATIYKWVGFGYTRPLTWAFKKDMPQYLQREAVRVNFGIFGTGYIACDIRVGILYPDNKRLQFFIFHLNTPKWVIGPRDASCAETKDWSLEWKAACFNERMSQLKLC